MAFEYCKSCMTFTVTCPDCGITFCPDCGAEEGELENQEDEGEEE